MLVLNSLSVTRNKEKEFVETTTILLLLLLLLLLGHALMQLVKAPVVQEAELTPQHVWAAFREVKISYPLPRTRIN